MEEHKTLAWQTKLEEYFADTAEHAYCFAWLHKRSEQMYSSRTIFIDLPVIILGTLNGAVSVGSESLFGGSQYASVGVGVIALLTAILSTIGSYFSWSRRAEGHRISSLNYEKLHRFLKVELSLPREERMSPADLLKYTKTEYDRLLEISPLVPTVVVNDFKRRFNKPEYTTIAKPSELNGLEKIEIYRPAIKSPYTFELAETKTEIKQETSSPSVLIDT